MTTRPVAAEIHPGPEALAVDPTPGPASPLTSFSRDGLSFPVHDGGPRDGDVVVLLHGFPQDSSAWNKVTPLLHEAGLRTLALDQRGYSPGNTVRSRRGYSLDALAGDVLALLDAAGVQRAHVLGHDWGGAVAWHLAGTSDRVISMTTLSTPHPAALIWSMLRSRQVLHSWYMAFFQIPWLPERLLAPRLRRFCLASGLPEEAADRYADRFADPAALTGPMHWYRSMLLHRTRTPASRVPTTYIWGNQDFALGRVAARRSSAHVRGDYRFIEVEAGHWLPETHAVLVAREIVERVVSEALDPS